MRNLKKRKPKANSLKGNSGQSLIEYLIIVALIAIGSIGIVKSLGQTIFVRFANITQALQHRDSHLTATAVSADQIQKRELDDFFKDSPGLGTSGH